MLLTLRPLKEIHVHDEDMNTIHKSVYFVKVSFNIIFSSRKICPSLFVCVFIWVCDVQPVCSTCICL